MITAVFDCVVYVQVVLSRNGPAFACFSLAEQECVTLYLSAEILDEVKRSLDSPSLRKKYPSITGGGARFVKRQGAAMPTQGRRNGGRRSQLRDPPAAFWIT